MPIPDAEKLRYADFVQELWRELDAIAIPPETILWHYTTGSSLVAILESMTLYSTHISCLNDSSEVRYGASCFREALKVARLNSYRDELVVKLIDGALEYLKENPDFPAQAVAPHFVACFSEEKDDLSQWRAYGGGEDGYAIAFRAGDLWGCPNSALVRVNYDSSQHCKMAQRAVEAMIEFFFDGLKKCNRDDDAVKFGEEFLPKWEEAITMIAPLLKDPGFNKERECRITKGFPPAT